MLLMEDYNQFKLANAMIYTKDEPEGNEQSHPPPSVSQLWIPGSRTRHNVPPFRITAYAEALQEPLNAEMLPELETSSGSISSSSGNQYKEQSMTC